MNKYHSALWDTVNHIAQMRNTSCSGLAVQCGLDSTSFNQSKRKTNVYDVRSKNIDGNRNDACSVCRNLSKIPEQRKIICPAGQRAPQNATRFNLWLNALVKFRGKLKYPDHNK